MAAEVLGNVGGKLGNRAERREAGSERKAARVLLAVERFIL